MKYAIMNSSYATQATVMQCLFLKGYLHVVSDSENKTSMIRLQSPQIFMWRLFRWRRKWLIAKKDLLVVQLTAWPWILSKLIQRLLRISTTIQLHLQNVSDGIAHCADFKSTWQQPRLKSESPCTCSDEHASIALYNFAKKHPWCLLLANILTE